MTVMSPFGTQRQRPRLGRAALLVLSFAGTIAGLGGCDRGEGLHTAIAEARNTLTALGAGGAEAAPLSVRSQAYDEVVSLLQDKVRLGGPSLPQAQGVLAEALAGQGDVLSVVYRDVDAQVMFALTDAHAKLMLSFQQRGLAAALEGYDPRPDIEKLDSETAQRQADLKAAESDLAEAAARVNDLRDRAKSQAAAGNLKRQEYGAIRSQALNAAPIERPNLVRRANDIKRAGEKLLVEAELLDAEADRYAPDLDEKKLQIDRLQRQIASLDSARRTAQETARMLAAQAQKASGDADAAALAASGAMTDLGKLVEESLKPAFDAAMAKYDAARNAVSQARDAGGRSAAQTGAGAVHLARASLLREYALSLARVAAVLGQAASATPPIPDSAALAEASKALAAQSAEAVASAAEALEQAASAFQSAGGDETSLTAKLAARLEAERQRLAPDPAAPEAPPASTDEGQEPPAEGAPAAIPEGEPAPDSAQDAAPEAEAPADPAPTETPG